MPSLVGLNSACQAETDQSSEACPTPPNEKIQLSDEQLNALFNILTHEEAYAEIEGFKFPDAVAQYGYPFTDPDSERYARGEPTQNGVNGVDGHPDGTNGVPTNSTLDSGKRPGPSPGSPLLQTLLLKFVLPLPGIGDLDHSFWNVRVRGLLTKLADAGLSESYDKGAVGTRKTLATAASAVIEAVARGCLGGYPKAHKQSSGESTEKENGHRNGHATQNRSNGHVSAEMSRPVNEAWDELLQGLIHGDLIDELCDWLSKTDDLEAHSPLVKEAAEYAIIHLASFIHHVFVVSSEGQYLLKLIENTHKMVPYLMMGKIFKYGNAATMLNAMVKLLLTKLSLTSLSNWAGITQNPYEGMNLLQRIISGVLSWDASNFTKSTDKIEKAKDGPSAELLKAIKQHVQESCSAHGRVREASIDNNKSIVIAILKATSDPKIVASADAINVEHHRMCLQYYSALLSARDRAAITNILCRQTPDLLTEAVRECVAAYEPMIRLIHDEIDLGEHLNATQAFIDDLIKTSSPNARANSKSGGASRTTEHGHDYDLASVEDYVGLLKRHRGSVYKWLFHLCSKCPTIRDAFRDWAKDVARALGGQRCTDEDEDSILPALHRLFTTLPSRTQSSLVPLLNSHAAYLSTLQSVSNSRTRDISATHSSRTAEGPGMYLASWQDLLDNTLITPDVEGGLRTARDVIDRTTPGKPNISGEITLDGRRDSREVDERPTGPDVAEVISVLGPSFRSLLQDVAKRAAAEALGV